MIGGAAADPVVAANLADSKFNEPLKENAIMTHNHQNTSDSTVQDPVCGMEVDPTTAKHTSDYQGRTYSFCSLMCRKAFEDEPERYLKLHPQAGT